MPLISYGANQQPAQDVAIKRGTYALMMAYPASAGDMWYDTDHNITWVYNRNNWRPIPGDPRKDLHDDTPVLCYEYDLNAGPPEGLEDGMTHMDIGSYILVKDHADELNAHAIVIKKEEAKESLKPKVRSWWKFWGNFK